MESPTAKLETLYSIRCEQIKNNKTINYGHNPTAPKMFLREKKEVSSPFPLARATSDTLQKKPT